MKSALAFLLVWLSAPAAALSGEPPASSLSVSAELTLHSDYRFRGISLSDRKPAFQADVALEHDSGFYAGLWSSTLSETEGGAKMEADPYIGYYTEIAGGFSADFTLSYYDYPSDSGLNYAEATAVFAYAAGPLSPRLELNYAPRQAALVGEDGRRGDNFYASAGLDYALPGAPVTLIAQAGYERGVYDYRANGGKTDWSLGLRMDQGPAKIGLTYIDTDLSVRNADGRQLAGPALLASLALAL
ncbi:hypothetical protein IC614_03700 [Allosphingosinicella flava]|uniref:Uncharacterized protein n=1 Tax=Allosphingosinicella flava TaxID=2771430 RepID=A0A7T2GKU4_9SPHN|nr:TorF family putative porin [Sphingosinicella flava]QPQ55709.1 hypothetical protein IC614_03700 [Sphingosinicella flava]